MPVLIPLLLAAAQTITPEIHVQITSPPAGQPVFGTVTVAAEIHSQEPITQVSFFVDGWPSPLLIAYAVLELGLIPIAYWIYRLPDEAQLPRGDDPNAHA